MERKRKYSILQKGAISLSLIGVGILIISAVALPLVARLVGQRQIVQQKAALRCYQETYWNDPTCGGGCQNHRVCTLAQPDDNVYQCCEPDHSVSPGDYCENVSWCQGGNLGVCSEGAAACSSRNVCQSYYCDQGTCAEIFDNPSADEIHTCRVGLNERSLDSGLMRCCPSSISDDACRRICFECYCGSERECREAGGEVFEDYGKCGEAPKCCSLNLGQAPTPTPTSTPAPVCSGSCYVTGRDPSAYWSCGGGRPPLNEYECYDAGSGPNSGCAIDYEVKDTQNCLAIGKKCVCQANWWCSDSMKPAGCTCCSLSPTPTPTVTLRPTATATTPTRAPSCPGGELGDLNCDSVINMTDLTMLLDKWGTNGVFTNPAFHKADIAPDPLDGIVNMTDLVKLLDNWGRVGPTPTR